jgi:hypothetical protein
MPSRIAATYSESTQLALGPGGRLPKINWNAKGQTRDVGPTASKEAPVCPNPRWQGQPASASDEPRLLRCS